MFVRRPSGGATGARYRRRSSVAPGLGRLDQSGDTREYRTDQPETAGPDRQGRTHLHRNACPFLKICVAFCRQTVIAITY